MILVDRALNATHLLVEVPAVVDVLLREPEEPLRPGSPGSLGVSPCADLVEVIAKKAILHAW